MLAVAGTIGAILSDRVDGQHLSKARLPIT
jgi:hypothetical protein